MIANTIIHGCVLDVLPTLPEKSVQMCVTSPPYWGLRDYGTATWEGGDVSCSHEVKAQPREDRARNGLTGGTSTIDAGTVQRDCHCGARRVDSQLGLESTPQEFVAAMVRVFREVRRVLADDGTCWINLGDSYNAYNGNRGPSAGFSDGAAGRGHPDHERGLTAPGLKPKDLCGIPWRVAFALQDDGWYLRQDIIWAKPNPMPESVTDRCTKAHEYLFLLSKRARYYFDAEAIAEQADPSTQRGTNAPNAKNVGDGLGMKYADFEKARYKVEARNRRSVWTVTSAPYADAHFATFPPKLIEPCILAGSRAGDIVLDPFFGSGTTGQVCETLGRQWLGIELSAEYIALARRRTAQQGLGL